MSFTILLQDDQNKKIEFKNGEKKIKYFKFSNRCISNLKWLKILGTSKR